MKAVVTGAGGFVGSRIVRALSRAGWETYAIVRGPSPRLEGAVASDRVVRCDLASAAEAGAALASLRPDVCVHAAWYAVPGEYLWSPENDVHQRIGIEVARAAAAAGCRRFVGIGTCLEYAPSDEALTEHSPAGPTTPYATSKLALLDALLELGAETGMQIAWARLFFLHGPHEDERRLVPSVISSLLDGRTVATTPGDQVRDFLHVDDAAEALRAVATADVTGPVNVASGVATTVRAVVTAIGEILGRRDLLQIGALPYPPGEQMVISADNRLLVEECAWAPTYGLEQGLRETVRWWQTRRSA